MRKIIILLVIGSLLSVGCIYSARQTTQTIQTTYIGLVGNYESYSSTGSFVLVKQNQTMKGTISCENGTQGIYLILMPIPPSVPARPGLYYGFILSPCLSLIRGIIIFYGDNMCHMYGSWSYEGDNGWFAGDLQSK